MFLLLNMNFLDFVLGLCFFLFGLLILFYFIDTQVFTILIVIMTALRVKIISWIWSLSSQNCVMVTILLLSGSTVVVMLFNFAWIKILRFWLTQVNRIRAKILVLVPSIFFDVSAGSLSANQLSSSLWSSDDFVSLINVAEASIVIFGESLLILGLHIPALEPWVDFFPPSSFQSHALLLSILFLESFVGAWLRLDLIIIWALAERWLIRAAISIAFFLFLLLFYKYIKFHSVGCCYVGKCD